MSCLLDPISGDGHWVSSLCPAEGCGNQGGLFVFQAPKSYVCVKFVLSSGIVTSPNHPGNYPNNLKQMQTIQVKQGMVLSLQFTVFDIEFFSDSDNEEFQYDYDVACQLVDRPTQLFYIWIFIC